MRLKGLLLRLELVQFFSFSLKEIFKDLNQLKLVIIAKKKASQKGSLCSEDGSCSCLRQAGLCPPRWL
jgi:hypothetical protein